MAGQPISRQRRKERKAAARARKGNRPETSAEPGNRFTVTHGGTVTAKTHAKEIEAKVAEVEAALAESAPVRTPAGDLPPADAFQVRLLAREWVRYENMLAYVEEQGLYDATGEPRQRVLTLIGQSADRLSRFLDKMGMTPTSRAKLGLDLVRTASFAEAMSEPDKAKRMKMLDELGIFEGEAHDADDEG